MLRACCPLLSCGWPSRPARKVRARAIAAARRSARTGFIRRCRTPPPAVARSWPGVGPLPGHPAPASRYPAGPGPAAAPRRRAGPARRCRPRPPRQRRPAPPTGCAGARAPAVRHRR
ncbi:hypothetical protein G6F64_014974 [Rhizopus arrhizus]|uniref:Uncharacterized protein n=1 Tax=Rhizopus oryzae TaxID=64495 RepID=A0A9P7BIB9_RHIOR|nr:hypothetical protein G6F64_014974 [Rhizopus arrhizus]